MTRLPAGFGYTSGLGLCALGSRLWALGSGLWIGRPGFSALIASGMDRLISVLKHPSCMPARLIGSPQAQRLNMNFSEAIRIALQSLWANKLRSILTLLGVVIGV